MRDAFEFHGKKGFGESCAWMREGFSERGNELRVLLKLLNSNFPTGETGCYNYWIDIYLENIFINLLENIVKYNLNCCTLSPKTYEVLNY
jgi:hypothetical protein